MRLPTWVTASAAAAALAGATWIARPAAPAPAQLVLAVPAPSASSTAAGSAAEDWPAVVRALDAARLAGFADPVSADPTRWLDQTCRCLAEERARLDRLMRAGQAVRAAAVAVRAVRVLGATGHRVMLEVTDTLAAYDVVSGAVPVARYPGRAELTWRGVLVRTEAGWRWADVVRGGPVPAPGVDRADVG